MKICAEFQKLIICPFQIAEIFTGILSIVLAIVANVIAATSNATSSHIATYISSGIWCGLLVSSLIFFEGCLMQLST